jgi:ABC-type nitrate/sulfonate/bicarbonate transport system substrate-binding protein
MKKMTGIGCVSKKSLLGAMLALSAMTLCVPTNASAEDIKLAASAIGRPPIFSNTFVDVGQEKGYWKKAGLDVSFRWFQRGTDTAKAVVTGDVQLGYTATPPAVNLIASGAPVVIIAGMPNQDWLVASDDPAVKGCKDLKGQTIAADGINNARYLFIQSVLQSCSLQLTDVKLIDLANAPLVKAGIAGQVHSGVFHVDELAQVEFKTNKKWTLIKEPASVKAGLHYAVILASKKAIAENREGVVRFLEGWIMTQKLMGSTAAGDTKEFAKIAANASQIDVQVAENAIKSYHSINYWANNDGIDQKQLMAQVDDLVKVGLMKAENKPSYDKIVDRSLYAEALKRVQAKK